jgi:hypothetical protein
MWPHPRGEGRLIGGLLRDAARVYLVGVAAAEFVAGTLTGRCPGGSVVTPAGSGPGWAEEPEPLVEV